MKRKKAIICDIDGVLNIYCNDALKKYRNKDYDGFVDTCLNLPTRDIMVNKLHELVKSTGAIIIFMTGRPARVASETTEFLTKNFFGIKYELYMRSPHNYQPSVDLKRQWTRGLIRNTYEILHAYDDRRTIRKMYSNEFLISSSRVGRDYFGGNNENE